MEHCAMYSVKYAIWSDNLLKVCKTAMDGHVRQYDLIFSEVFCSWTPGITVNVPSVRS